MGDKYDSDVGSSYPGAGEGPKGLAVRQLKRYASWVQTVQQLSLFSNNTYFEIHAINAYWYFC